MAAVAVVVGVVLAAGFAGCGASQALHVRGAAAAPVLFPPTVPSGAGLAIGITEQNPNFIWSPAERAHVAPGFDRWRDTVDALRPALYRLPVNWSQVQPDPARPPNWDLHAAGCLRAQWPCGPWAGVREQLDAIRSRQRHGGLDVLVDLSNPPAWATPSAAGGCEINPLPAGARGVQPQALNAYAQLARSLLALAAHEGVTLRYWSPWNEPNTPQQISPQRAWCSAGAPSLSPARYAELARALLSVVRGAGGELVLGETAAYGSPRPARTGAVEFVDGLPSDVLCSAHVWAQHVYVSPAARDATGTRLRFDRNAGLLDAPQSAELLRSVHGALLARGCPGSPYEIWVTETGVGAPKAGSSRPLGDSESEAAGCRELAAALGDWNALGFVGAAVQFSFREDTAYAVGLVDIGLTRLYPAYDLWRAWGARAPGAAPPPLPSGCRR